MPEGRLVVPQQDAIFVEIEEGFVNITQSDGNDSYNLISIGTEHVAILIKALQDAIKAKAGK